MSKHGKGSLAVQISIAVFEQLARDASQARPVLFRSASPFVAERAVPGTERTNERMMMMQDTRKSCRKIIKYLYSIHKIEYQTTQQLR